MAKKQKAQITGVEFKDPKQVIEIKSRGLVLTAENLTLERYIYLTSLSPTFEQYFKVTKSKNNELETKE